MLRKLYYIGSVATVYLLTIGTIGALLYSSQLHRESTAVAQSANVHYQPVTLAVNTVSGNPTRIIIPDRTIDLPIDNGTYNTYTKKWTVNPLHANFAVTSVAPNNRSGTTFVYGHGTDQVFGKIGDSPPPIGSTAEIHTDNGHVFHYELALVQNLKPSDTWIIKNTAGGRPRLIVQTCTGIFSEWRTMFVYQFKEVV